MKTQISRNTFNKNKRYSGVFHQMGRVMSDADWNELAELDREKLADIISDVIGSGTPRNRGIIEAIDNGDGTFSYELRWGYAYVDGIIAEVRPDPNETTTEAFEFDKQQDFPLAPTPVGEHKLYLDVWERTVTGLEDGELLDPALHGADTCTRTQTMAQVKWCDASIQPENSTSNPTIGNTPLSLEIRQGSTEPDPCDPCADELQMHEDVGNYLFRVEVHEVEYNTSGQAIRVLLKWSSENGAEQFVIDDEPPGFVSPNWAYEFFSGESEQFASEKHLGRHLASGFNATHGALSGGYPDPVPSGYSLVRRWDGYCELTKSGTDWQLTEGFDRGEALSATSSATAHGHVTEGATVIINLNSLTLTSELADSRLLAGDYWLAPVRQAVHTAGSELITNELPRSILHHYMTLGTVAIDGTFTPHPSGHCTKFNFPPLTDLRADNVCYDVPPCDDSQSGQATVRQLLESFLGDDFPDPNTERVSIRSMLDAILCSHSAATLPLLKNDELCPTLQENSIQSVQDALNALCVLEADSCSSITIHPGPNWQSAFMDLPQGQDAHICFRAGTYLLDDILLVDNKGHLKITGAGPGTRIICNSREAAIHFNRCASVQISDVYIESGGVGNGGNYDHLLGALTIQNCRKVTVEDVMLKCSAGTRLGVTCLTVNNDPVRLGTVSVTGCDLSVGHSQIGVLLLNTRYTFVQNNTIKVRPKPASLTLERQMTDKTFAAAARKLLLNNAVIRNFETTDISGKQNIHMAELNQRRIAIDSSVSAPDWRGAILDQAAGTTVVSNQNLLSIARKTANKLLTDSAFRARFRPFNDWFEMLRQQNPATAHKGIVCGGQFATDVQILNNSLEGVQEGIHIGLSDHSLPTRRIFRAGKILINGNSINVIVPPAAERRRGGIFVGNCNNLSVQDNQILVQRFLLSRRIALEGIRVHGYFGPMMMLRQNYMTHCNVGIRITLATDDVEGNPQWLVRDNMMPNSNPAVDAPASVIKINNKA